MALQVILIAAHLHSSRSPPLYHIETSSAAGSHSLASAAALHPFSSSTASEGPQPVPPVFRCETAPSAGSHSLASAAALHTIRQHETGQPWISSRPTLHHRTGGATTHFWSITIAAISSPRPAYPSNLLRTLLPHWSSIHRLKTRNPSPHHKNSQPLAVSSFQGYIHSHISDLPPTHFQLSQ